MSHGWGEEQEVWVELALMSGRRDATLQDFWSLAAKFLLQGLQKGILALKRGMKRRTIINVLKELLEPRLVIAESVTLEGGVAVHICEASFCSTCFQSVIQ